MPLMSSIRKNLATMFAVLAFLFILMIVFEWGMDLSGRSGGFAGGDPDAIGEVNGQTISYKQFSELVRRAAESQKSQTGQDPDEETERMIRSQVWNQMVEDILVQDEIKRLGITVTDQEIRDVVQGPNPPEFLTSQFRDSTGTFRRDAYLQAMMNPQNKDAWLQVEEIIREQQKRSKLQSLLLASVGVAESDVLRRFMDRTAAMDVEYVLFDFNRLVPDTAVTVTDDDLEAAYRSNPEDFKTRVTRRLKYVSFNLQATAMDTAQVLEELGRLREQAVGGTEFTELAGTYSERPQSDAFFKRGELGRVKEKAIAGARKGDIVGPVADVDGMHLIKLLDERQGTQEFVNAAHILIRPLPGPDSVKALAKARDLARQARGGADFAKLARENSEDGSAAEGGELGYTGRGGWVKPFEDAAFGARPGQIVGPIRSQFGWHVIKVLGRDKREVQISIISMQVKASARTVEDAFRNADDFAYLADKEGFEKAAEIGGYVVQETPEFTKDGFIPGIGANDMVASFAFKSDMDDLSRAITLSNAVGVFKVSGVREEGVRPMEEVLPQVRSIAYREKRLARTKAMAEAFVQGLQGSTDIIAAAQMDRNLFAARTGPFKPTDMPSGVGRDPRFIGMALALPIGSVSSPVEGQRGHFVMKVVSRSQVDTAAYAVERASLQSQLLQEKQNRFLSEWQRSLRENATIEDNRDRFYR
ncbi:MAG: peptidylprolyl isomerase [Bacteroidetes bacterium]|jgi:parvulin-like peptidyl-prolyl isomerase|nr:peptidylprolyl isomerase [Bacteroidota bacterium]